MSDEKPITYNNLQEMPRYVISEASMLWNRTGTWRYLAPRYLDQTPPCNNRCPAGNDVEGFIRLIEAEEYARAAQLIREENPFPAVCGRVCYHPCETVCNRAQYDDPVAIHSLERMVADVPIQAGTLQKVRPESGKRVAIIGSGPAGLTAAYHLARMGHGPTVFEAHPEPGGLLRYGIPTYRLPREILNAEIDAITSHGVEIKCGQKVGTDIPWTDLVSFDAIFISIGVHQNRQLGLTGEKKSGVLPGLGFLQKVAAGEAPGLGRQTIVIGGGNTAIDSARCAVRLGSKVSVYYHRSRKEMPAFEEEIVEALKEGVKINFLTQPVKILSKSGKVIGIQLRATKLGKPDDSGRRRPESVPGSEFDIQASTIITAIGESADLDWLPKDISLESGRIQVDDSGQTSLRNVFAGGDAALSEHNVTIAIGSGKTAACAIDAFLNDLDFSVIKPRITIGETGIISVSRYLESGEAHQKQGGPGKVISYENINTNHFKKAAREKIKTLDVGKRLNSFNEVNGGLNRESAVVEAKRCFHCGVCNCCDNCYIFCPDIAVLKNEGKEAGYTINMDYCKGCGICVNECPRGAMIMEKEQ